MAQKPFIVRNGLEVDTNLIFADASTNKVGIGTSIPNYTLHVSGGALGSDNLKVSGISTVNNLVIDGYISIGNTTGKDGQFLVSTGVGVTWSKLSKNSILVQAIQGQTSFDFTYQVGTAEVYLNGVRLSPNEFVATNGTQVLLNDPCFGGETVEILANQVLPVAQSPVSPGIGLTVQDEGVTVGTASSISLINFVGTGVSVTSAGSYAVNVNISSVGSSSVSNPPGKTVYVAINGNDANDGLTLDFPKRTVKAAVGIATAGDTIKVSPGTYVEDNPITLLADVSIEGAELRNCIITPQNPNSDLFWVSNGNHLTDLSFHGQTSTSGSAVVAFKPLVGVSSDRFFDAARMIRYNIDFISAEAVGYLTSTDYRAPAFTLNSGDYSSCKNDIKLIMRAVCHDITRGGNSKCVGAGLSYYNGPSLQHIVGVKTETIDALRYAAGIAASCINNVTWTGGYQNHFTQIRDLSMPADSNTGFNTSIASCSNVLSAVNSCVGVVTTIINGGPSVVGDIFNLTYPGNNGAGVMDINDIPSQGVGVVTKGPYLRNCTNFIPGSIGMKVDGFHADPGDKDDIGITGMMNVDSFTQYNQGGIGVEISNGAYAQLVSIFTICTDKGIVTKSGGQCDITNSNSSFGTEGLVSDGLSDPTTKSNYRYTANVSVAASEGDTTVVLSGVGNERPYSGQALYFGELYYEIQGITITNGGSGYTEPPTVVLISDPTGPSAIKAEAIATINDGSVNSIIMIGRGRNYKISDNPSLVTFTPPIGLGNTAAAIAVSRPLYYQVRTATPPSGGISTVTLAQALNSDVGIGVTTFLFRQSLQIVSSHSFEYVGAGNTIELARPSKGGVTIQENEVIKLNGGEIVYTSTDQDGNFAIGEDLVIDQATGTIRGRAFERSLLNTVTPFIIALGAK
jgi:cytochrome c2